MLGIEPGAAGWEASMLPLCYAAPLLLAFYSKFSFCFQARSCLHFGDLPHLPNQPGHDHRQEAVRVKKTCSRTGFGLPIQTSTTSPRRPTSINELHFNLFFKHIKRNHIFKNVIMPLFKFLLTVTLDLKLFISLKQRFLLHQSLPRNIDEVEAYDVE